MKSPLNWLGGKPRLSARIASRIPEHVCYVEPFCGAAWVLFKKQPSKVEVLNDINGEISNFFRVLQNHLEEFVRHFKFTLCSREHFERERDMPAELLRGCKGRWILSQADHPLIRDLYSWANVEPVTVGYSVGKDVRDRAKEVLVSNF